SPLHGRGFPRSLRARSRPRSCERPPRSPSSWPPRTEGAAMAMATAAGDGPRSSPEDRPGRARPPRIWPLRAAVGTDGTRCELGESPMWDDESGQVSWVDIVAGDV